MKEFKSKMTMYDLKKIQTDFPKAKITSSKDCDRFIRQFYGDDIDVFESFFVLMLNNSNNTLGYAKISQGGITGTIVDVRIVAKYCVDSLATACILAHNHPSGKKQASISDKDITQKVKKALELFDIKVLDHIILMPDNGEYLSFADDNLL